MKTVGKPRENGENAGKMGIDAGNFEDLMGLRAENGGIQSRTIIVELAVGANNSGKPT